jgi:hypothetical protein
MITRPADRAFDLAMFIAYKRPLFVVCRGIDLLSEVILAHYSTL